MNSTGLLYHLLKLFTHYTSASTRLCQENWDYYNVSRHQLLNHSTELYNVCVSVCVCVCVCVCVSKTFVMSGICQY